jgi:hypothetical protein
MMPGISGIMPGASAARVPHVYWRIFADTNNGDASFTSLAEVEFRGSVGGSDLGPALTAITAAQALKSGEAAGLEAWKAFDDVATTAWAHGVTTNAWIGRDFGAVVDVVEVALTINDSPGATFARAPATGKLQYSDDASTWVTVFTFGLYGWIANSTRVIPETPPAAGFHRFWRVNASAVNGGTRLQIAELEFRATVGGADQANSGRVISTAGSSADTSVFDNNTATEGVILATSGFFGYVFPSPVSVAQVAITGSANTTRSPKDFTIQSSDDGVTWATEKTVTGETTWTATQTRTYSVP